MRHERQRMAIRISSMYEGSVFGVVNLKIDLTRDDTMVSLSRMT